MDNVTIFGAGLAGLIAARMLPERNPIVYDRSEAVPHNHKAVLRFRTDRVGVATNIPFEEVTVDKAVVGAINHVDAAIKYSLKTTGKLHKRSVMNLDTVQRWVAPDDFIPRLASTTNFVGGVDFQKWSHNLLKDHGPVISTIPVDVMMDLFKWPDKPDFQRARGWNLRVKLLEDLDCNMHMTIYNVGDDPWYRATLTSGTLIFEGSGDAPALHPSSAHEEISRWLGVFGLEDRHCEGWELHEAKYQKIVDLDRHDRDSVKRFIMMLSSEHNIHSLGRFATWRPKLLLDDVVNDVRIIEQLIGG